MKIPGYKIEQQIGQGGMAVVYYAIQESLARPVALKVMNPLYAHSPEFSERFLNEGRLLASLRHSHIMTIYDIGVSGDYHYLSMEYVDGGDLRQRIRNGIPPSLALDYIMTLGSCLQAAHKAHIVHRDVKPANILFRRDGTLLLTDFGIAKQLGDQKGLTATGNMVGSPYYLSPEQALGRPIDGRADIYSLGIVLYEMLVGEKPLDGDSAVEVVIKHIEGKLPRLPQHLSHVQRLFDRMTAKKPADRFSDAASMLQAAQHLRDRGLWDGAEAEKTVILAKQRQVEPTSAGAEMQPDHLNAGGGFLAESKNFMVGQMGKRAVVVSVLALAAGIAASGLIGPKHRTMPTKAVRIAPVEADIPARTDPPAQADTHVQSHVQPQIAVHARVDPQPQAEAQSQIAVHAHTDPPAQADTHVQSDTQSQVDAPVRIDPQPQAEAQSQINELLRAAQAALSDYRLTTPDHDNAYYYYQKVLEIDPENHQATAGFSLVADRYLALAKNAFAMGQDKKAEHYVKLGLQIKSDHPELLAFNDMLTRQVRHSNTGKKSRGRDMGASIDRFFRKTKRLFD
jgi:serine/threonine-protein kinase PpkA